MKITVKQYKAAVAELGNAYKEILQTLYYFPNSTATAKQLALALGYKDYRGANRHIGEIGKRVGNYLGIEFDTYYDSRSGYRDAYFKVVGPWKTEGWEMWPNLQMALLELGLVTRDDSLRNVHDRLSTEIESYNESQYIKEGKVTQVFVNRYERSFKARRECLKHHGHICKACDLDLEETYGKLAEGYIHVHHIKPLHEIGKNYSVDPVNDLVPLCPNCHAVIHLRNPVLSVEELRALIRKSKKKK